MTQKEAVEKLVKFLPEKASHSGIKLKYIKSVNDVWANSKSIYASLSGQRLYHFSKVSCNSNEFDTTPCICIKVSGNNHIVWFKEHLPHKGDCR
jgi:hypothetical protein